MPLVASLLFVGFFLPGGTTFFEEDVP